MVKTTNILDYIVHMANCVEFDNPDVSISQLIYEHYDEMANLTFEETLEKLHVSRQRFKKYIYQIGCKNYTEFKDDIIYNRIFRMKLIKERYYQFDQERCEKAFGKIRTAPIDMNMLDTICKKIYESQRMIFYGSPTLLNLLFDFQIDMRMFGKPILISSVNNSKVLAPQEHDLIGICTATGRLLGCCDAQFEEKVLKSKQTKILFTKDNNTYPNVDYVLPMLTENDYYEMHYVFLFYIDMIKTRYYELFVKGN